MNNTGKNHQTKRASLERKSGIALWRQIADQLLSDINTGLFSVGERLPGEIELAQQFDVNRHSVRAALNALANEAIVESRQGKGTFVKRRNRIVYPIGKRTRFSDGLSGQAQSVSGALITHAIEPATETVAQALGLDVGAQVIRLETLSRADDTPISRATSWFSFDRFGDIATIYESTRSITQSLKQLGVDDYVRLSTQVEAHRTSSGDAQDLRLSSSAIVLVTQSINGNMEGHPIQFARTRFAADRVSLMVSGK